MTSRGAAGWPSVAVDATPVLGQRTGVGRYVSHLLDELAAAGADVRAAAFTLRRREGLARLPVRVVHRPVPARLLHRAWVRGDRPTAETVMGRADVVHGTNFVLPPSRRAAGVVTIHDLSFLRYPELVNAASLAYRELVPRGLARAARVITPSQAVADEVADAYRLDPDRLAVTPLGVDPSWFEPVGPLASLPSEYVLAVGTLEPRKGLDVLLAAYGQLAGSAPDAPPLVLVGPPGWGPELELGLVPRDRVQLTGYLSTDELRAAVAHASVLAYPSRYEGFGLPPLEALAAGTPVVASDIAAVREATGGHARLVPAGDVEALAEGLRAALAQTRSAEQVEAGRAHAAGYTWAECARRTIEIYQQAAG